MCVAIRLLSDLTVDGFLSVDAPRIHLGGVLVAKLRNGHPVPSLMP